MYVYVYMFALTQLPMLCRSGLAVKHLCLLSHLDQISLFFDPVQVLYFTLWKYPIQKSYVFAKQ